MPSWSWPGGRRSATGRPEARAATGSHVAEIGGVSSDLVSRGMQRGRAACAVEGGTDSEPMNVILGARDFRSQMTADLWPA